MLETSEVSTGRRSAKGPLILALSALVLACSFFHTAWVSDDAYITFRVVRNVLDGYGPVWNFGERVQVYTHPLWVLTLVATTLLLKDVYLSSIALSGFCLAIVAWYAIRLAQLRALASIALVVLATSRIFIDYSSSGLENPLTHALIGALAFKVYETIRSNELKPRNAQVGAMLASLLILNRLDLALAAGPMMLYLMWRLVRAAGFRHAMLVSALAILPVVGWLAFSTYYYGAPFPNTYFAKLSTGIPPNELREQGLRYLLASFRFDEPSVVTIGLALIAAPWSSFGRVLGSSILLYLLYVINIGGDFMAGRFLSTPFLLSIFVLLEFLQKCRGALKAMFLMASSAFVLNIPLTVLSPPDYKNFSIPPDGIADERGHYNFINGLQNNVGTRTREHPPIAQIWMEALKSQATTYETCYVGMLGYYAPKSVHIVDGYGLTDPFLARLPSLKPWRIGHFERPSPPGYPEVLTGHTDGLRDTSLLGLWRDVELAHRAQLNARGRMEAIIRLNSGYWDDSVAQSDSLRKAQQIGKQSMYFCRGIAGLSMRPVVQGK
jgi:arabinofuranosyltransferase